MTALTCTLPSFISQTFRRDRLYCNRHYVARSAIRAFKALPLPVVTDSQLQIRQAVVSPIPVNVMNCLLGKQRASQTHGHNQSVFWDISIYESHRCERMIVGDTNEFISMGAPHEVFPFESTNWIDTQPPQLSVDVLKCTPELFGNLSTRPSRFPKLNHFGRLGICEVNRKLLRLDNHTSVPCNLNYRIPSAAKNRGNLTRGAVFAKKRQHESLFLDREWSLFPTNRTWSCH